MTNVCLDASGETFRDIRFLQLKTPVKGLKNGDLLRAAATHFDVLLTVDRKMSFQQNVAKRGIAVVVLIAKPNRYPELSLLVPKVLEVLETIQPGETVRVGTSKT